MKKLRGMKRADSMPVVIGNPTRFEHGIHVEYDRSTKTFNVCQPPPPRMVVDGGGWRMEDGDEKIL